MSLTELCDQDAAGAETAAVLIQTRSGPLYLCGHHYRESAFLLGMLGYPVLPIRGATALLPAISPARELGSFI